MSTAPPRSANSTTVRTQTVRLIAMRSAFVVLERLAPRLGARWAMDLWCTPPANGGRRRDDRPRPGAMSSVDVDGHRMTVETWGEGPAVYLVHGWGGWRGQLGGFVEPLVAAGRKVVTFDAPGHGTSEPGALGKGRTNGVELARSLAVVAAAHGHPTAVVAHSFGCATTVVAMRDGLAIDRLVCVAPSVDPMLSVNSMSALLGLGSRTMALLLERIEAFARRPLSDFDPSTFTDRVPRALLIHDRQDKEVPYGQAEVLAAAWPAAEVITTDGLGHQRILRDEAVIAQVVDFATQPTT